LIKMATTRHEPSRDTEVPAFIGLGANLGDARAQVLWAAAQVSAASGLRAPRVSSLYRSAPVDASGNDYCNAVMSVLSTLPAPDILLLLQNIEQKAGRERPYRHAPRTLDLDLLLYGEARIQSQQLIVPHPRLHERAFVLQPLAELAPERVEAAWLAATAHQACSLWRDQT
jgi:2-amino-4-hydroxy-6-hydroxymethyldihydropteridine diphosphokinase